MVKVYHLIGFITYHIFNIPTSPSLHIYVVLMKQSYVHFRNLSVNNCFPLQRDYGCKYVCHRHD
jgi:hypothetical protein